MIQELLGVGMVEERKIPISGCLLGVANESTPSSCSPAATSASSSSAAAVAAAASTTNAEQQNLRCPRCDSTNTKFCYYNNYNLTQPRHFCKTCRRYWTQGGALRNVPIGGGCRKTKSVGISLGSAKSGGGCSGTIKAAAKPSASDVIAGGKSGFPGVGSVLGFDHDLPASPILWPVPQNSHLLSLLRVTQNPGISNANSGNPSHSLNPIPSHLCSTSCTINNPDRFKEEGQMGGSHLVPETSLLINALNARNPGVDPLSQLPFGLCNSLWRSSPYQSSLQHQPQHQPLTPPPPPQPNSGMMLGENPGASGIQELIQRLRNNNNISQYADYHTASTMVQGNGSSSTSYSASISSTLPAATSAAAVASAAILEPAPVTGGGGEFGCWNSAPNFAWADMPNINGAFP